MYSIKASNCKAIRFHALRSKKGVFVDQLESDVDPAVQLGDILIKLNGIEVELVDSEDVLVALTVFEDEISHTQSSMQPPVLTLRRCFIPSQYSLLDLISDSRKLPWLLQYTSLSIALNANLHQAVLFLAIDLLQLSELDPNCTTEYRLIILNKYVTRNDSVFNVSEALQPETKAGIISVLQASSTREEIMNVLLPLLSRLESVKVIKEFSQSTTAIRMTGYLAQSPPYRRVTIDDVVIHILPSSRSSPHEKIAPTFFYIFLCKINRNIYLLLLRVVEYLILHPLEDEECSHALKTLLSLLDRNPTLSSLNTPSLQELLKFIQHEIRSQLYLQFLDSEEYELMLAALDHGMQEVHLGDIVSSHIALHRVSRDHEDSLDPIEMVGTFRVIQGELVIDNMLGLDAIGVSVEHFIGPSIPSSGRRLHHFAFPMKSQMRMIYGCAIITNRMRQEELVAPLVSSSTRIKNNRYMSRGRSAIRRLFNTRLATSTDSSCLTTDETTAEDHDESGSVAPSQPSDSPCEDGFNGAFVLSSERRFATHRDALLHYLPILEAPGLDWNTKTQQIHFHKRVAAPFTETNSEIDVTSLVAIGSSNLSTLLVAMLLEVSIVIKSSNIATLVPLLESLQACIAPLKWTHIYVPYLPQALEDLLESPVPLLVGILHHSKKRLSIDVLLYDLDLDSVLQSEGLLKYKGIRSAINHLARRIQSTRMPSTSIVDIEPMQQLECMCSAVVKETQQFVSELLAGLQYFIMPAAPAESLDDTSVTLLLDERLYKQSIENSFLTAQFVGAFLRTQALSEYIVSKYK